MNISIAVKDTFYYIPAKIIPAIAGLLGVIVYPALLGSAGYGVYVIAVTTLSFVTAIIFTWLNSSCLRFWQANKVSYGISQLLSTSIIILIIMLLVVGVVWTLSLSFIKGHIDQSIILAHRYALYMLLAKTIYDYVVILFRADRMLLKFSFYTSFTSILVLLGSIVVIYYGGIGPEGIFIVGGCVYLFVGGIELLKLCIQYSFGVSLFSMKTARGLAEYGLPLISVGLFSLVISSADRYMISYYMSVKDVGVYNAVYTLSFSSISIPSSIIISAAVPIAFKLYADNTDNALEYIEKTFRVFLVLLMPVIVMIPVISADLLALLYADEAYYNAADIFYWVTFGSFMQGLAGILVIILMLYSKTKLIAALSMVVAMVNLALNSLWIPEYGIEGAASATCMSYLSYFILVIMVVISDDKKFMFPWRSCLFAMLGSMTVSILMFQLMSYGMKLVNQVVLCFGLYLLYLYLLYSAREKSIDNLCSHMKIKVMKWMEVD